MRPRTEIAIVAALFLACARRAGHPVDIGGRSINLDCAGRGFPAVVLISGAAETGAAWTPIQRELAKTTTACWSDRAGEGESDAAPYPLTSAADARDLHEALHRAGVPPPYVLVGHSLGGLDARVFAGAYTGEVAGMVLVDSAHEDEPRRAPKEYLGHTAPRWLWHPLHVVLPARASRGLVNSESYAQAHAARGIGSRPLIVLTRGRPLPPSAGPAAVAYEEVWKHEMQPQLLRLSTDSRQIIVAQSGHGIPDEAPGAVIDGAREIVAKARLGAGH